MRSAHSSIPDTNRTSGTMRPFLPNRAGRAAGAIALPATPPRPTDAASPPPGTIPTRSPVPVSAADRAPVSVSVQPVGRQPKLLDRLAEALRARHYSPRTEQTYRHWVKRFIFFHNVRHPSEMAEPEINAFLTHLAVREKVSASTQTQALSALLFLYRHVIGRQVGNLGDVIRARKPTRLPS